jgi:hypothetical protein
MVVFIRFQYILEVWKSDIRTHLKDEIHFFKNSNYKFHRINICQTRVYNINILLINTNYNLSTYNFNVGNVMNYLSFKSGVDSYLSVLVIAMHAFLAVVAVGTLLFLIGAI